MQIIRNKLDRAEYLPSKHIGGKIEPELIVLHDTAGRLEKGNSVGWLRDNPGKASAHFVIERDGEVIQLVPTNRRANHAGRSQYHGKEWCNGFSIGIEIVNPGKMRAGGNGTAIPWFSHPYDIDEFGITAASTPEHGSGMWMPYTEAQIAAVIALCAALLKAHQDIQDIRAHWYVSPGRKVDTNPLFPMEQVRNIVLGRDETPEKDVEDLVDGSEWSRSSRDTKGYAVSTGGDTLNMRSWPSFNPNVLAAIPDGTVLFPLRKGHFGNRRWSQVEYGGKRGWVVSRYLKEVKDGR
ncbi:MAG: N-acetylmuramoyl-L-alanine amidase [Dinoroseobacter sp.]|nr:N-acetylmuramoyl-L-alanine amidase [Dinoroseobacter sp.]